MSAVFLRIFVLALLFAATSPAAAQPAAECPTTDCPQTAQTQTLSPAHVQMWRDAASIHQLKIAFVDALQRFVRAQAGTFGNEADDLRQSLAAMRKTLSAWDLAIQQFQSKSSRGGRDAETEIAMATVWLDRHRLDNALRALDAAEQRDDRRLDLHTLRALAYGAAGRSSEAARALRRAVAIDPRNPTLSYALAQHLARLKQPADSVQALRGVHRALDDRQTKTAGGGRPAPFERVDLLRQVSGAAPIFPGARYAAGFAALESGDYETALARFDKAVASDPMVASSADTRARVVAAASALDGGQLEAARQHLQQATEGAPADSEPHRLLGLIYWVDEQSGKSIEHLRRAIQLAPGDERARVLLSDVLTDDRRLAEAERELTQARDAGLRSGQTAYRLARLYERQSLLPQAAKAFEESESYGPVVGRDRFYQEWGSLLVNRADFDGAVAAYAKRIDVNTNSAEAHRKLGEIYFLQGRDEEALAEFSVAAWLDPKDARAHAAAGQVYVRLLKYPEAIAALRRALSIDGTLREARYGLGTALMRAGRSDEARTELDVFARQQAEAEAAGQREFQLDALRRQAAKDLLAGDRQASLARFEDAARLDPQSARSHRDLGLALLRAQRPSDAIEHLVEAQRVEETAEGFVYLIDAHAATGNAEEAGRQRTRAREFALAKKMERVRVLSGR